MHNNSCLILFFEEKGVSSPGRLVPSRCFRLSNQYLVDSQGSYLKLSLGNNNQERWCLALCETSIVLTVTLPATTTSIQNMCSIFWLYLYNGGSKLIACHFLSAEIRSCTTLPHRQKQSHLTCTKLKVPSQVWRQRRHNDPLWIIELSKCIMAFTWFYLLISFRVAECIHEVNSNNSILTCEIVAVRALESDFQKSSLFKLR